jgi:hypothetical protein
LLPPVPVRKLEAHLVGIFINSASTWSAAGEEASSYLFSEKHPVYVKPLINYSLSGFFFLIN